MGLDAQQAQMGSDHWLCLFWFLGWVEQETYYWVHATVADSQVWSLFNAMLHVCQICSSGPENKTKEKKTKHGLIKHFLMCFVIHNKTCLDQCTTWLPPLQFFNLVASLSTKILPWSFTFSNLCVCVRGHYLEGQSDTDVCTGLLCWPQMQRGSQWRWTLTLLSFVFTLLIINATIPPHTSPLCVCVCVLPPRVLHTHLCNQSPSPSPNCRLSLA